MTTMVTKKQKAHKVYCKKKKKFEDYKHCLESIQHKIKINQSEKINLMQIVFDKVIKNR